MVVDLPYLQVYALLPCAQGLQGHQHGTYGTTDWPHLSHGKGKQQEGIGGQEVQSKGPEAS